MSTLARPRLVFVSPLFLFPNDAGGKIRTTNILRGLKGGAFEIILVGVATAEQQARWATELAGVCDEFVPWAPQPARAKWQRAGDLLNALPVNVVADRSAAGRRAVQQVLARPDINLVVFDFVHSAVLCPDVLLCPSLCFTHNVEAEIFARHASQASDLPRRLIWQSQHRKMVAYEGAALRRFDAVIAVSERDAAKFRADYAIADVAAIPTGVDLDFFAFAPPPAATEIAPPTVVFTGSMDWDANIDGVRYFLDQVWPLVLASVPEARFRVVGRSPPASLTQAAAKLPGVEFTGFVDDVRSHVHAAQAFVIPLLVGGGTRIKAFEAMAMGCPVVSTAVGIEGLGAESDQHFLERDGASAFAEGVIALLQQPDLRTGVSGRARALVEDRFGHRVAAEVFEAICTRIAGQLAREAAL
ncbi:MAG: glycosyltransferase [Rhizobacter sp.]|nr:glycosyltransferase [Rhizobacter sp.]